MRWVALLVLLAVLPTVELTEQIVHVVEHALHAESFDHSAHHTPSNEDEHGCTGLIHLCSCHQSQVTASIAIIVTRGVENVASVGNSAPASLRDLTLQEPAHRPPIG